MVEKGPEAPPLFLHIGAHKTGSTSIQMRFARNAETLKRHGVLYPLGHFPRFPYQHSEIVDMLTPERVGELASYLGDVLGQATASGCRTIVLSGEAMSNLSGEKAALLHDAACSAGFRPIAVVFFRPYVSYVRSLASEMMKKGDRFVTPRELAERLAGFDEAATTERFASAFEAENVIRHDLADGEDCIPLLDRDIGLAADIPSLRINRGIDFATLCWLNAVKAELDMPLALASRLYSEAFSSHPPVLAAEIAFLSEVAGLVRGPNGDRFKAELARLEQAMGGLGSLEAQLDYLKRLERFVTSLRRHMRRRGVRLWLRRRISAAFGARGGSRGAVPGTTRDLP